MKVSRLPIIGLLSLMLLSGNVVDGAESSDAAAVIDHATDPWFGDLEGMFERGFVRFLTTYNPLFFSYDGIDERGLVVEIAHALEKHLNAKYGKKDQSLHVVLMPVTRDRLLADLVAGKGDIAAANLTITPARQALVDFSDPTYPDVNELLVSGPSAPGISSFDDLVSTDIHVRKSSSYFEHLSALNKARKKEGKAVLPVQHVDERLEDYDLLEMVDAGIIPVVIVDSHKAALWAQVFSNIVVHENLAVHSNQSIGWAVRPDTPALMKAVNTFVKKARKGTLLGNVLIKRYLKNTTWIDNVRTGNSRKRYDKTIDIIKRYSGDYDFDWLMIAAQAYQESKLDQSKRSPAGAIGIMQLLPSTAADPNVNIPDIHKAPQNVHAGVKYLRFIRDRYFSDADIDPLDQVLFSFAAYNAGPANIARARKKAVNMGFDRNKWFGHVEVAASKTISREPVIYVRNIYKYYIAYKHLEELREGREAHSMQKTNR